MRLRNFINQVMFTDVKKIVLMARERILQPEDMPSLPKHLDPHSIAVDENRLNTKNGKTLLISLLREGKPFVLKALVLNICFVLLNLLKPILVNIFVHLSALGFQDSVHFTQGIAIAIFLGLVSFVASLFIQHYFLHSLACYQIFTNSINRILFRHSLKLSQKSRGESQLGDIVNHMSSDSDAVTDITLILGDLLIFAITLVGVAAQLLYFFGATALLSLGILFLTIPLTRSIAKRFSILDEKLMKERDTRVTLMSQALNGIRILKYFVWETSIRKEIMAVRRKELHSRQSLAKAETLATLSYSAISTLALFGTFGVHIWRGGSLSPELAFTAVTLFALLEEPFAHLSELVSRLATAKVSGDRICAFLQRETLASTSSHLSADLEVPGIIARNVSVKLLEKSILSELNFNILPREAVAIVGSVGCGKSALLQALLKELPLSSGNFSIVNSNQKQLKPKIAFVPQEAFIINGSMKENLLFGALDQEQTLQMALRVSCLDSDLGLFPSGIYTEIGEKGVNLSGGQKQRVSLARAVMSDPTLALLDDPLSAVDLNTETELVDRLLFGAWNHITRIVVTHRLAYLYRFHKIIFMNDGRIIAQGTLDELLLHPEFLAFFKHGHGVEKGKETLQVSNLKVTEKALPLVDAKTTRVTDDEDRAIGAVKNSVYWDYLKALGGNMHAKRMFVLPMLFLFTIGAAALPLLRGSWLAYSSNAQAGRVGSLSWLNPFALNSHQALWVYGFLGVCAILGSLANRMLWLYRGIAAGRDLHNQMLDSVLGAPLRFFDSTPMGRILQRFSRDVESVDIQLQWSFETTVRCFVNITTALFLLLTLLPAMVFAIVPLMLVYYRIQKDYRRPAREAKRLDSISRSPRYAHFKETLQGLPVIRSFGKSSYFEESFLDKLAFSQRMFYGHYMLNRWFSSRVPLLGGLISSFTGIGLVYYSTQGKIGAGATGLALVYALSLWENLNWVVRIFAEVEAKMTSVERIRFYGSIEPEPSVFLKPETVVPDAWPKKGEIVFDRAVARYASHLPPVLKDISFHIPAGKRVGIIGRTGSGKSTLLQSLFRGIELESGEIRIDGVNIASVPLHRLRKSIAIIPQDPTLFLGTLRSNLDRFQEFTDENLWDALERARLATFVRDQSLGLLFPVQEGGSNLSQGQRQLLCLARALLSRCQIIVMDEATASVDAKTDSLVQEVVRKSCKDLTMVIIAHRLGTVADADFIFEVREGKLHRTLNLTEKSVSVV